MPDRPVCELEHDRPRAAAIRVHVKSTRIGKPGHPMTRELAVCATHAKELRGIGIEVIWP